MLINISHLYRENVIRFAEQKFKTTPANRLNLAWSSLAKIAKI